MYNIVCSNDISSLKDGLYSFKTECVQSLQIVRFEVGQLIKPIIGNIDFAISELTCLKEQVKSRSDYTERINESEFIRREMDEFQHTLQTADAQKQRMLADLIRSKAEAKTYQLEMNLGREKVRQMGQIIRELEKYQKQQSEEMRALHLQLSNSTPMKHLSDARYILS